jgi:protein-tyrosine phosphatase
VSVIDRTWDREQARRDGAPAVEFLHRAYLTMLDDGADRFAEAFTILAGAEALPAVFHCAAGKDRTGLLAALVLGAIGVAHEAIVDDYALTQDAMERFLATMALDEEAAAAIADTPPAFFVADPEAMRRVLDDVVARHGSVGAYVRSIGVDADVLDELAATLLVRA